MSPALAGLLLHSMPFCFLLWVPTGFHCQQVMLLLCDMNGVCVQWGEWVRRCWEMSSTIVWIRAFQGAKHCPPLHADPYTFSAPTLELCPPGGIICAGLYTGKHQMANPISILFQVRLLPDP